MTPTLHQRLSIAGLLLALSFSASAQAQYVWLNEKGSKQYSDMPPPASVSQNRILKEPGKALRAVPSAASENEVAELAGENSTAAKDKAPLTIAEKNADFQRRKMERAEKDKKADEQAKYAAAKAKNCERTSTYQRSLQAGERIARSDKNGERHFLDDQQRAQEIQENKRTLDECK